MKITKITQQLKQADRYSIYVDDKYAFSLSESALLESGLVNGQELSAEQVEDYKRISADDKLYIRTLRYAAMRPRSTWEIEFYLQRKNAASPLVSRIIRKLLKIGILNDRKFAESFVHDRRLLRSQSGRRLRLELQERRIPSDIIDEVLRQDETDELGMLRNLIDKKRRQTRFKADDQKLMQYLARQGFSYSDIKEALSEKSD